MADTIDKKNEKEVVETQPEKGAEAIEQPAPPFWHEKVKAAYPDRNFETDEDWNSGLQERYSSLEDYERNGKEANKKLIAALEADPLLAELVGGAIEGIPALVTIAKHVDPEDLTAQDGDEHFEELTKAYQDRVAKRDESAKFDEEVIANKIESSKIFDQFAEQKGMSDEEKEEYIDFVETHLKNLFKGLVSLDYHEAMYTAKNHDKTVNDVAQKAALAEKNKKVETKKVEKAPSGDGLPKIGSTGDFKEKEGKKPGYFDRLEQNSRNKNNY